MLFIYDYFQLSQCYKDARNFDMKLNLIVFLALVFVVFALFNAGMKDTTTPSLSFNDTRVEPDMVSDHLFDEAASAEREFDTHSLSADLSPVDDAACECNWRVQYCYWQPY